MHLRIPSALVLAGALAAMAQAELLYGVNLDNTLLTFDSSDPSSLLTAKDITGLGANEEIRGIDFRPLTGELYALGSSSQLYRLDIVTGAATAVGGPLAIQVDGAFNGFDFNPVIDRIRVVSDTDGNLVVNPITGALQLEATDLTYGDGTSGNPSVIAAAYSNNVPNASTTQLYVLDARTNSLYKQNNNGGVLTEGKPLGMDFAGFTNFDISGATGLAYASLESATTPGATLYTIDLGTGALTSLGEIGVGGVGSSLRGLAVAPVPEPMTMLALGAGAVAMLRRRRRA